MSDMLTNINNYKISLELLKEYPYKNCVVELEDDEYAIVRVDINNEHNFNKNLDSELNPINIKSISFVIDGQVVEFIRTE